LTRADVHDADGLGSWMGLELTAADLKTTLVIHVL
jgi:hypothetical protein